MNERVEKWSVLVYDKTVVRVVCVNLGFSVLLTQTNELEKILSRRPTMCLHKKHVYLFPCRSFDETRDSR